MKSTRLYLLLLAVLLQPPYLHGQNGIAGSTGALAQASFLPFQFTIIIIGLLVIVIVFSVSGGTNRDSGSDSTTTQTTGSSVDTSSADPPTSSDPPDTNPSTFCGSDEKNIANTILTETGSGSGRRADFVCVTNTEKVLSYYCTVDGWVESPDSNWDICI